MELMRLHSRCSSSGQGCARRMGYARLDVAKVESVPFVTAEGFEPPFEFSRDL
jgi:hypothetical protein